jgi:predicted site-specific integrase-resolvase
MPVDINGRTYYRTAEVCQIVGIGKSTLFRWIRENIVKEVEYRDRKGWRLFTGDELDTLVAEASRIQHNHASEIERIPSSIR